jgi:hypothetical protein
MSARRVLPGRHLWVLQAALILPVVGPATNNVTSGTVNVLAFFNHLVAKGWIPSTSTLGAIDYGVELVSTSAMDATFTVTGFSLTTN